MPDAAPAAWIIEVDPHDLDLADAFADGEAVIQFEVADDRAALVHPGQTAHLWVQDREAGANDRDAVIESAVRRFRPIVLTAAAAVLAMVPLTRSDFFGPMAVAIMGGLVVATALTLLFLPALYAAWYRVRI